MDKHKSVVVASQKQIVHEINFNQSTVLKCITAHIYLNVIIQSMQIVKEESK